MSRDSQFRHQVYAETRPSSPHHVLSPGDYPSPSSAEFRARMKRVGEALREANVAAIYLVHGTFVGSDALGIVSGLARVAPGAGRAARRVIKRIIDKVAGEAGNYTPLFARRLERAINQPGDPDAEMHIPVRLFHWSSENHHIGRADGAVRLVDELASLELEPGQRVMLWGHSHAGNVFALMTNLLSGNQLAVEEFFQAADIYYRWPLLGVVDIPVWERVHSMFAEGRRPLENTPLDIVTFGTPIRYGWNSDGYANLLHFINRHPSRRVPEYRAAFPPKLGDVMHAADGDYIQQLGIAGTNVMPSLFSWRAWLADQRLHSLLQGESSLKRISDRFNAGAIVPDEGTTLLVDYGPAEGNLAEHLAGHAVYTQRRWMLFHAEEIVRRFYEAAL